MCLSRYSHFTLQGPSLSRVRTTRVSGHTQPLRGEAGSSVAVGAGEVSSEDSDDDEDGDGSEEEERPARRRFRRRWRVKVSLCKRSTTLAKGLVNLHLTGCSSLQRARCEIDDETTAALLAAAAAAPSPVITPEMAAVAADIRGVAAAGGLASLAEGLRVAGIALVPLRPADARYATIESRAYRGKSISMPITDAEVAAREAWAKVNPAAESLPRPTIRRALKALFNPPGAPEVFGLFLDHARPDAKRRARLVPLARITPLAPHTK